MSAALAMSLDDIIKNNKNSGSRNLRVRRRGHGPARRFSNRAANRAAPYSTVSFLDQFQLIVILLFSESTSILDHVR